jgi:glycosyltransferase involved in cell wall biosynthesis
MACGIPVITSDLPSSREQVGDAGLIVEVGNVEALSDGICKVLSEPARQREMAQRSQERSQQFSWVASARKMVAIFDQVMREPLKEYGPNA